MLEATELVDPAGYVNWIEADTEPLSEGRARQVTSVAKHHLACAWRLLGAVYRRSGSEAIGYGDFAQYVEAEFASRRWGVSVRSALARVKAVDGVHEVRQEKQ